MIEFYQFSWGSQVRRYTTSPVEVSWNGHTWLPSEISRGAIKLEAKLEASDVTINCSVSGDVPALFKTRAPLETVGVAIYRGDEGDVTGTTQSIWMGEVGKVIFGPTVAKLTCSPSISIGRGRLPIGRFSVGCRWQLYSPACGVNVQDYTQVVSILSVNAVEKTMTFQAGPTDDANFVGGFYTDAQGRHTIMDIVGDQNTPFLWTIKFDKFPASLETATTASLSLGCNHSTDDCRARFGNIYNYGGFPAIPPKG